MATFVFSNAREKILVETSNDMEMNNQLKLKGDRKVVEEEKEAGAGLR